MTSSLEFVIALLAQGRQALLHQAQAVVLDFFNLLVLGFHGISVLLLQVLDESLEVFFGLVEIGLLCIYLLLQLVGAHGQVFFNFSLGGIVTEIQVGRRTDGLEVLISKLLEAVKVTSSLVVFQAGRVSPLEGRKSTNAIGITQGFALIGSAINFGHDLGLGILELIHELVPIGFHLLAMTAPRSKELNEGGLAFRFDIVVVSSQLDAISSG
mmetsp:Transcript_53072/g.153025  ORF Transcript_53072/g.153025 Transcript_53072/m.153025 type:complete len:212 (+) Transcript_53072:339-974(+)